MCYNGFRRQRMAGLWRRNGRFCRGYICGIDPQEAEESEADWIPGGCSEIGDVSVVRKGDE